MHIAEVKAKVIEGVKEWFPALTPKQLESYDSNSDDLVLSIPNLTVNFRFSKRVENLSRAFAAVPVVDLTVDIHGNPDEARGFAAGFKDSFEQKLLRGGG